ncbi:Rv3717 family N-acetylmuramoyl-L-alanine amidase [Micropruina glycogenica]
MAGATPTPAPSSAKPSATPTASAKTKPLAGRTIVVDPGHNAVWTKALLKQVPAGNGRTKPCNASGTAGGSYAEHTFTWQLGQALVARLQRLGATVELTRPNDRGSGPCVNARAAITNRAKADLLISLHADGNLAQGARGYHIIVSSTMVGGAAVERRSAALARDLRTELDATRTMPRSTYIGGGTAIHARTDIAGLNLINVPGVMLELGNMRNASDLALQRSPQWRATVAKALAAGAVAALA